MVAFIATPPNGGEVSPGQSPSLVMDPVRRGAARRPWAVVGLAQGHAAYLSSRKNTGRCLRQGRSFLRCDFWPRLNFRTITSIVWRGQVQLVGIASFSVLAKLTNPRTQGRALSLLNYSLPFTKNSQ